MSRSAIFAALAAAAAVTAAAGASPTPRVIRLISLTTSERAHDAAPHGPSRGDTYSATDALQNAAPQFGKPKGVLVGSDTATFTYLSKTRTMVDGRTHLPGGTIVVHGISHPIERGFTAAVTSGGGAFEGARGTIAVTLAGSRTRTLNVYRLSYAR